MAYVALYCRISKDTRGRVEGVKAQEKWGRDYGASAWPGIPVRVFADNDLSAANGDHRPEYEALRAVIRNGEVAHLWTVEQSRLERREVEWFELAAELDAAGISEVHTNRDGIVRVRDEVAGIKAVLAAAEVRKLKRRVNDRLAEIAAEGRPHGGRTFGYRPAVDDDGGKTLEVVPAEAEVLRDAAHKVLAGWSLTNLAADLDRRGVRGANGSRITYKTLYRMLTNPTVAGHRVHRRRIVSKGVWEPILDESTWQAVRAKLAAPRTVRKSNGGDYEITQSQYGHSTRSRRRYLLTGGIAVCGICGSPLSAQRRKVKGRRLDALYFCRGGFCVGIMADPLERHVADVLFAELDKPAFLDALAADDHVTRRDEVTAELSALEAKRGDLAELWGSGDLSGAEWQTARRALAEHEQRLRADLAAIPPPLIAVDIATARGSWESMTLDERREFISLFVKKVTVKRAKPGTRQFDKSRVVIEWRRR
jgi:DNA invertase Pin-like site-specific DNA recombinase